MGLLSLWTALPQPCRAELYLEGYLGAATTPGGRETFSNPAQTPPLAWVAHTIPGRLDTPKLLGGLKIGIWFVRERYLIPCLPDWMEHFGLYVDAGYQGLNFQRQRGESFDNLGGRSTNIFQSEGDVFTVAFMAAARHGFFKDSQVSFGRLQPYIAAGPALLVSRQKPSMVVDPIRVQEGPFRAGMIRDCATVLGLQVEPGIRWMVLKNVSIDLSFKYRYGQPSFQFDFTPDNDFTAPGTLTLAPDYHLMSGQLGIAYHF